MAGRWKLPGYTEVRELGRGGTGTVVLAVTSEGDQVAIKYLDPRFAADVAFREAFGREARLLAEITSPHVVQLHEYVESVEGSAMVMDLVEGASLRATLTEHGATEPESALAVLKGSLLGLDFAHRAGVVHRDYKPENVLLDLQGCSLLADFGVSMRAGGIGDGLGTPTYMAPEQWSGGVASPSADVYAATAVFVECITGTPPYSARDLGALRAMHETAPVPAEDLPTSVRDLARQGLAKSPEARPADAGAFLADLERAAVDGYGSQWEERGRADLARRVALLAPLLPGAGVAVAPANALSGVQALAAAVSGVGAAGGVAGSTTLVATSLESASAGAGGFLAALAGKLGLSPAALAAAVAGIAAAGGLIAVVAVGQPQAIAPAAAPPGLAVVQPAPAAPVAGAPIVPGVAPAPATGSGPGPVPAAQGAAILPAAAQSVAPAGSGAVPPAAPNPDVAVATPPAATGPIAQPPATEPPATEPPATEPPATPPPPTPPTSTPPTSTPPTSTPPTSTPPPAGQNNRALESEDGTGSDAVSTIDVNDGSDNTVDTTARGGSRVYGIVSGDGSSRNTLTATGDNGSAINGLIAGVGDQPNGGTVDGNNPGYDNRMDLTADNGRVDANVGGTQNQASASATGTGIGAGYGATVYAAGNANTVDARASGADSYAGSSAVGDGNTAVSEAAGAGSYAVAEARDGATASSFASNGATTYALSAEPGADAYAMADGAGWSANADPNLTAGGVSVACSGGGGSGSAQATYGDQRCSRTRDVQGNVRDEVAVADGMASTAVLVGGGTDNTASSSASNAGTADATVIGDGTSSSTARASSDHVGTAYAWSAGSDSTSAATADGIDARADASANDGATAVAEAIGAGASAIAYGSGPSYAEATAAGDGTSATADASEGGSAIARASDPAAVAEAMAAGAGWSATADESGVSCGAGSGTGTVSARYGTRRCEGSGDGTTNTINYYDDPPITPLRAAAVADTRTPEPSAGTPPPVDDAEPTGEPAGGPVPATRPATNEATTSDERSGPTGTSPAGTGSGPETRDGAGDATAEPAADEVPKGEDTSSPDPGSASESTSDGGGEKPSEEAPDKKSDASSGDGAGASG